MREIARARTAVGQRHRDHATTGSTLKEVSSALSHYFFGPNLDQKLTFERFLQFQKQLHQDVLWLEVGACVYDVTPRFVVDAWRPLDVVSVA